MLFEKNGFDWNACVGNNGIQDDWKYADGYALIPIIALDHLSRRRRRDIDILIYPIIYCARHSIELFLKEGIRRINEIRNKYKEDEILAFIRSTHSIAKIWGKFVEVAIDTDRRFISDTSQLKESIDEIEKMDSEGQTFRYSSNINGQKNLVSQSVINFPNFVLEFKVISNKLHAIRKKYDMIREEYNLKTYTNSLSRKDLEVISKMLPPISHWRNESELPLSIQKIMRKYKISKKECTKAIDIIKYHKQFKENIGIYEELPDVSKKDFLLINRANTEYLKQIKHDNCDGRLFISSSDIFFELESERKIIEDIKERFCKNLNSKAIKQLYKIYYIGCENIQAELYEFVDDEINAQKAEELSEPLEKLICTHRLKNTIRKGLVLAGYSREIARFNL